MIHDFELHLNTPLLLALLAVCMTWRAAAGGQGRPSVGPWCPDYGDGTYKNPVIFADYSDPDVIRVGDDFYLTASSFSCMPGLPVLHSKDLVNWTIIGHGFERYPIQRFDTPHHGAGVWAPAIRFHDGWFYIYFGDPDNGVFMTRTQNPAGPWQPLVLVKDAKGWIDTCPFWDDDGQAYLVHAFAGSRAGVSNVLHINRMSQDGTRLLDEGTLVVDGKAEDYTTVEGPKLYKHEGHYYIMAPGGGVPQGYQIVFRSKNIFGPYESKIVLRQGSTPVNGPHQGGWVQTQSGQDWFIHFQEELPYGRIIHLQPMKWVDGWPVMGDEGEPVLTHAKPDVGKTWPVAIPQTTDEFDGPKLGLQWQWWANFDESWYSLSARPGILRMNAVSWPTPLAMYDRPNLLLQKFPSDRFTVTADLDCSNLQSGDRAGVVVAGMLMSAIQVETAPGGLRVFRTNSLSSRPHGFRGEPVSQPDTEEDSTNITGTVIQLRLDVKPGGECSFSYSTDNRQFVRLGKSFKAVNDLWIGAKIGVFCNAPDGKPSKGFVDVDWFRFGW